mgnify:CR=1 FL=1
MPAKSKSQQRLAAVELERARKGQPTRTGMSEAELKKLAETKRKGLPDRAKKKR